jgi:2-polyprenyl-6-methoxyphenol hydroxylase-like FAD-dependent oxidoreductase
MASSTDMPDQRGHAVVIGASIAGLLAARALSETYARITVIDRDTLPDHPATRRGVPQGRLAHALLAAGADAMEELFPGLQAEMIASGAFTCDLLGEYRWYLDGYPFRPAHSGLTVIGLTRPLLEHLIRARVADLPGVTIVSPAAVTGLETADGRVTGVLVRTGATEESMPADLVLDAAGRGSRALLWRRELGYPEPPVSEIRANMVYLTRHYRREPHFLDGTEGATFVPFPAQPRGALVLPQENDQFALVLAGMLGEEPPSDDEGMLAFAESLPAPEAVKVLRLATPLDEPVVMRYPASVRHYYEKADKHPDGFLVTGDALCSFNPVYGQGLTVAALEAVALARLLAEGTASLPARFYAAAAKVINVAWDLAAGGDLRYPEVEGRRPAGSGLVNRYLDWYRAAASVDAVLGATFLRVANLTEPPSRLMAPGHVVRVLRSARKAVPVPAPPLSASPRPLSDIDSSRYIS